jgi:hypothetical protein
MHEPLVLVWLNYTAKVQKALVMRCRVFGEALAGNGLETLVTERF